MIAIHDNPISEDRNRLQVLKTLLYRSFDSVCITDRNGITLEINKAFEELYGWTRDEIVGNLVPMTPDSLRQAEEAFARSAAGEDVVLRNVRKLRKNGTPFLADVTISTLLDDKDRPYAFVVIETDVTGERETERKLQESEERYRMLVDSMPEPIVVYRNFEIVFVNPAACRLVGAERKEQLLGMPVSNFVHPDDWGRLRFDETSPCVTGHRRARHEARAVKLDGTSIYTAFNAVPISFKGMPAVQLLVRDITEQKQAEAKLAAKEKELSRILKLSPEPILLHQAGTITFVNDRAIRLLNGQSREQFVGQSLFRFFCPSMHPVMRERMRKVVESEDYMSFIELKLLPLEGDPVDVEVASVCVYKYMEQPVIQVVLHDLTERKRAEELIRRSEKLSVAGELAAGVAHEIRNPLTSLRGFLQLLKAKNTEYVDIMLMEIDRISYIVNEFLGMAKPQALHFVDSDLKRLIENVMTFMQPQALLYNVELALTVSPALRDTSIECEPNQMKQVYMNVLKNAIESMPRGGRVDISVSEDAEGRLLTRIVDQGVGIPEERLEKIGEPFFSLKESGTGLGLMVCLRIVEAHKGKLHIESVVGEGTTIEIALPRRSQGNG